MTVTAFAKGYYDIAPPAFGGFRAHLPQPAQLGRRRLRRAALAAFHRALKPGGILGVEDHRARTDRPQDPKSADGTLREDFAIELARRAGFELIGKSELLANPRDTKDYEKGVWTLPPTLALGEKDREKYLAIGEADNFLLMFRKAR